jgi:ankyrin repeat protein
MNKLREACIEGKMHQVHKYMPIVKQRSFPFKALEKSHKPLVYLTTVHGQLEVLKELIEMYGCDPHYKTERGDTLLYLACARGHSPVVRYLALVHKIDPNQQNKFKVSPLVAASNNGRLDTMVMLIDEFKCDPMAVTEKGESLLHKASGNGHLASRRKVPYLKVWV